VPDPRTQDSRICLVGDSLVHGVGDPTGLGWAGRVAERRRHEGWTLTSYQLGVRRDTGADIVRRLPEVAARLKDGDRYGLVVSFGVNDTAILDGVERSTAAASVVALDTLLQAAEIGRWAALVVGPPPMLDEDWNLRLRRLSGRLADECDLRAVRFADSIDLLHRDPTWEAALRAGDGVHPVAGGYARWAGLLDPAFTAWLSAHWP
jgi:lysophospholipase L1-like esterase